MELVAVYGTLKKGFSNYRVMEWAKGKYIQDDFVQIDKLDAHSYPMIRLSNNSNKYLKVELFKVDKQGIEGPLDNLEGYREGSDYCLYNRVKTKTLSGLDVWIYEINNDIIDRKENFYTHKEGDKLFYNWI